MSQLALKNIWENAGAKFVNLASNEVVCEVAGFEKECEALRSTAVLSDFSFVKKIEYPENEGIDFLDTVLAQNILKLHYGKVIDTFLASENGEIAAECFVGNIDDKLFLIAENLADDEFLNSKLLPDFARDLTQDFVLLNVDGPLAWKVADAVFGAEVLNLAYLSIEKYEFESNDIYLIRNGKTGEFGYQFLAPKAIAESLFIRLKTEVENVGGVLAGVKSLFNGRLEGNFFNIYAEGAVVKNPILLGLQWMIDFDKESFSGSAEIFAHRDLAKEFSLAGVKSSEVLNVGDSIFNGDESVGEIIASGVSKGLGANIGLAKFKKMYAYPKFDYSLSANGDLNVFTVAMPPIIALSLQNGLDS